VAQIKQHTDEKSTQRQRTQFRVITVTDPQTNKHTNRQGRLQYTVPQLSIQCKNQFQEKDRQPGLVTFYDIQPGNIAALFFQPRSLHGAQQYQNQHSTVPLSSRNKIPDFSNQKGKLSAT